MVKDPRAFIATRLRRARSKIHRRRHYFELMELWLKLNKQLIKECFKPNCDHCFGVSVDESPTGDKAAGSVLATTNLFYYFCLEYFENLFQELLKIDFEARKRPVINSQYVKSFDMKILFCVQMKFCLN